MLWDGTRHAAAARGGWAGPSASRYDGARYTFLGRNVNVEKFYIFNVRDISSSFVFIIITPGNIYTIYIQLLQHYYIIVGFKHKIVMALSSDSILYSVENIEN